MNNYQKEAEDFAESVGLEMKAIYTGHRARFGKHVTAVYNITLTRKGRFYNFDFSTSIHDSWERVVNRKRIPGLPNDMSLDKFFDSEFCYKPQFLRKDAVIRQTAKSPTMYDILACLTKSDPGTFSDFCGGFGYDEDSRKAFETYVAVQKEWEGVRSILGDVLNELQEIN